MGILKQHAGGKYLSSADIDGTGKENGIIATITDITEDNVARADDPNQELKAVLHFKGDTKPMVLNKGNLGFVLAAFGDDDKNAYGKDVLIWVDPDVKYQGKTVSGLRLADVAEKKSESWTITGTGFR